MPRKGLESKKKEDKEKETKGETLANATLGICSGQKHHSKMDAKWIPKHNAQYMPVRSICTPIGAGDFNIVKT